MNSRVALAGICCILLAACIREKASASVFCDADVLGLVRANAPKPENPRIPQPQFALILDSNAPGTLSGDVVLVTDDAAYDVNFSDIVAEKNGSSLSGITKPLFIGFSKPLNVRYAWVDQVGVNGAAPHSCPTNPFEAGASDGTTDAFPVPAMIYAINAFQFVSATFKMNLPPTDCKEPYREAKLSKWMEDKTDVLDTSAGLKTSSRVRVFLDSDGKVAYANISKSSGSPAVDNAAVSAAAKALYQPAIFRCTPVVSSLLVDVGYEVLH